ncbi:Alcohol dehydrogenase [NADP(+)] [Tieghemiomyces parasiticus]|uniref:Alcohol dehydrogenase [NADP(+)] n=1 Tax=Tieghemiomyces parasiticus TaxID=78921 RepID=A0A9W8DS48_9FUNG|nr:Alcohol dehydrogenase [NADP(+)] [Tieghemiomyces parasiticus]
MSAGKTFALNSGDKIPALGLGTWRSETNKVKEAVKAGYNIGYRHFDCAAVYENQDEVGQAFAESKISRDQVWVTSKLWNTEHRPDRVEPALNQTLKALGLDYLNLYLMHWPLAFKKVEGKFCESVKDSNGKPALDENVSLLDTWHAMEALVAKGKVRNIGVSNCNIAQLTQILEHGKIKPAVNQIEVHPYNPNTKLLQFCKDHGIHVTAYCPIGSTGSPKVLEDPAVLEVAKETGKTPAQVVLAWGIGRGTSVIPKSVTPSRIEENFHGDFQLTDAQAKKISAVTNRVRVCEVRDTWNLKSDSLFGDD